MFLCGVILSFSACDSLNRKRSGWIDIELVVYNDPTGNLHDSFRMPVSRLYFLDGSFIEELPRYADSSGSRANYLFIRDGMYAELDGLGETSALEFCPLSEKDAGVRFADNRIPGYAGRMELPDTSFGGYRYRRVALAADSSYTVFYIHQTDTVLPFSLATRFDRDYNGIVNRIDSYDYRSNRFSSLRLSTGDSIPVAVYRTFMLIND